AQDLRDRLELQVAARRRPPLLLLLRELLVGVPRALVVARGEEALADRRDDAHPRRRVALGAARLAEVRALRVLAERELDPLERVGDQHVRGRGAPPQLHDPGLAAR